MATTYECHNEACPLGNAKTPGRFTNGITQAQAIALTGDPEAPYGDGVCPNCGKPGVESEHEHVSHKGDDPNQDAHDHIAERVASKSDKLTAEDAQDALTRAVTKEDKADGAA